MNAMIRLVLGVAALCPATAALADGNDVWVAVSVDVTAEGRAAAAPAANRPVLYAPVLSGYRERGGILHYYQRMLPPTVEVVGQFASALADQGYALAPDAAGASIVLDFQWGTIAPTVAPVPPRHPFSPWSFGSRGPMRFQARNRVTNWDEVGTYVIGEKWPELAIEARRNQADPLTQEVFDSIRDAVNDSSDGTIGRGARYYVLLSALDGPAFLRHQAVLLWRTHVSTEYWGRYIDEVLPTLIDTAALTAGRETEQLQVITAPLAGWHSLKSAKSELTQARPIRGPAETVVGGTLLSLSRPGLAAK